MSENSYHPPRASAIALGVLVFAVLLVAFFQLSGITKWVGNAFLYLPARLGLIQLPSSTDIHQIIMSPGQTALHLPAGRYAVYISDYDLLTTTEGLRQGNEPPWINIASQADGQTAPIIFVNRGLMPYDCPLVPGRPVFNFWAREPGEYQLSFPRRPVSLAVVPDTTSGHESRILFLYAVQLFLLLAVPARLIQRRGAKRRSQIDEIKHLKHIQGEDFWKKSHLR